MRGLKVSMLNCKSGYMFEISKQIDTPYFEILRK